MASSEKKAKWSKYLLCLLLSYLLLVTNISPLETAGEGSHTDTVHTGQPPFAEGRNWIWKGKQEKCSPIVLISKTPLFSNMVSFCVWYSIQFLFLPFVGIKFFFLLAWSSFFPVRISCPLFKGNVLFFILEVFLNCIPIWVNVRVRYKKLIGGAFAFWFCRCEVGPTNLHF